MHRGHGRSASVVMGVNPIGSQCPSPSSAGKVKKPSGHFLSRPNSLFVKANDQASVDEQKQEEMVARMRLRANIRSIRAARKVIEKLVISVSEGADIAKMRFSGVSLESILREVHDRCWLAVGSSQVAVHSFVEYLERSDKAEFKNLFFEFKLDPPTVDAKSVLALSLFEVHDREDFNWAAATWLVEGKSKEDFAKYLREARSNFTLAQIIRYGTPVDRVEEKIKKIRDVEEKSEDSTGNKSLLAMLASANLAAQGEAILTASLEDVFSKYDMVVKHNIAKWLTDKPNKKMSDKGQKYAGARRNNVVENAIQGFLEEAKNGIPVYQWVASIITYRQAVQSMVLNQQQFDAEKDLRRERQLERLLNAVYYFFSGAVGFVDSYEKEKDFRSHMLSGSELTISTWRIAVPAQNDPRLYLETADAESAKFINGLEFATDIINKLLPEFLFPPQYEVLRKAAEKEAFDLIKKPDLTILECEKLHSLLSDGVTTSVEVSPSATLTRETSDVFTYQDLVDHVSVEEKISLLSPTRQCSENSSIDSDLVSRSSNVSPRPDELKKPEYTPLNLNAQDEKGNTYLHYVVQREKNQEQLMKVLLLNNLDITLVNHMGLTALDLDKKQALLGARNKRYGELLYRAIAAENGEQVLEILRHLKDFKGFKKNKEGVFQVTGRNKKNLLNLFVSHIPYSVHKRDYKEIFKKIINGLREESIGKVPQELTQAQGESPLLTAMINCCNEKAKLNHAKNKYVAVRLAFDSVIQYLQREIFEASDKERELLLLQLIEVQKAIGEIVQGKSAGSVVNSLKNSPILLQNRRPWRFWQTSETLCELEKIDVGSLNSDDLDNDIVESYVALAPKDRSLHLYIRRYDLAAIAAWVNDRKDDAHGDRSILAESKGQTPIELALCQTIECIEKHESFLRALKALSIGFIQIEIYLKGKQASYSVGSNDYRKIKDKLSAITLAKQKIIESGADVHEVLKELKSNCVINVRRNWWDFWHATPKTVELIDRMIKVTATPEQRLSQLIESLEEQRDTYRKKGHDYSNLSVKIEKLMNAKKLVSSNEPVLQVLESLLLDTYLITPRHWFSRNEINVGKALSDIVADVRYVQTFDTSVSSHVMPA